MRHEQRDWTDRVRVGGSLTFLTGGFTMTSSKLSSAFSVWKFSCNMAIFFSLSHPEGLEGDTHTHTVPH